ncbi:MAG: phosphoribosylglycinamide formyltransferase [Coriobacteriia bacterium]|nr:phosphoribosylglycinamide formyltransferase [Coriobacteriia bacterium]
MLASVAVLVSGGGTNLAAILASPEIKHARVEIVISNNEDAYALTRAKEAGVKAVVCKSENEIHKYLEGIDLVVLAGFMKILSKDFVDRYKIINIHPALIPSFCGKGMYGLHVHEAALAKGVKVSGATVHYVNEVPDGGQIIEQKAVRIKDGDTPETLQKRIMEEAEWIILPRAIEKIAKEIYEI